MFLIYELLIPLVLTISIELLVISLVKGYDSSLFLGVAAINMATNPVLNLILYVLANCLKVVQTGPIAVFLEIVIVFIEWGLLNYITGKKSVKNLRNSFFMNLASYMAGVLFFR